MAGNTRACDESDSLSWKVNKNFKRTPIRDVTLACDALVRILMYSVERGYERIARDDKRKQTDKNESISRALLTPLLRLKSDQLMLFKCKLSF